MFQLLESTGAFQSPVGFKIIVTRHLPPTLQMVADGRVDRNKDTAGRANGGGQGPAVGMDSVADVTASGETTRGGEVGDSGAKPIPLVPSSLVTAEGAADASGATGASGQIPVPKFKRAEVDRNRGGSTSNVRTALSPHETNGGGGHKSSIRVE